MWFCVRGGKLRIVLMYSMCSNCSVNEFLLVLKGWPTFIFFNADCLLFRQSLPKKTFKLEFLPASNLSVLGFGDLVNTTSGCSFNYHSMYLCTFCITCHDKLKAKLNLFKEMEGAFQLCIFKS